MDLKTNEFAQKPYWNEIKSFQKNFAAYRDKRIVLYGIARYTATIVTELKKEFHFVGLMDKDPENIGRVLYDLPIISLELAEKLADLIIINTSAVYWKIIYRRISNSSIPVFFRDGTLAVVNEEVLVEQNDYWKLSSQKVYKMLEDYDIVTFDIFDTLIMRKLFLSQDVFKLLEVKAQREWKSKLPIAKIRTQINQRSNDELLTWTQIYDEVQEKLQLSDERRNWLQRQELLIEESVCIPRTEMVRICNEVCKYKKSYIISDMYLPYEFIYSLLSRCGIDVDIPIWISAEKHASKKSGTLWQLLRKREGNKKIIHFGDNLKSDVEIPKKYGIHGVHIMSAIEMWDNSTIRSIVPGIIGLEESVFAGHIASCIFDDPFCLHDTKGRVFIDTCKDLGYVLYGGVIYCFLMWLIQQSEKYGLRRLFFMARDGYWLMEDFSYLKLLINKFAHGDKRFPEIVYLPISRSLMMTSSIDTEGGWENIVIYPYVGTFSSYVAVRMHLKLPKDDPHYSENICLPTQQDMVKEWLMPYKNKIIENLRKEKQDYIKYLENLGINDKDGVVDLWYNGNNQFYLSKILGKRLTGFYFAADLSPDNRCCKNNRMIPCFQKKDDLSASRSNLVKMTQFVEAFLTAPYGMILSVDEKGNFKCAPDMENQRQWDSRIEMNEGIKEFMRDMTILGIRSISPTFIDDFWGELYQEKLNLSKKIRNLFYFDNVLVKERESEVFQ